MRPLLLGTLMLIALVLSSGTALAAESHELIGSFGPDGTEASSFTEAKAVAVDETAEAFYVLDRTGGGSLFKFNLDGNPVPFSGSAPYIVGNQITGLSVGVGFGYQQIGVDPISHNIYVTSNNKVLAYEASGEPYVFTAGPDAGKSELDPVGAIEGVAVDRFGTIYTANWVGEPISSTFRVYDTTGNELFHQNVSSSIHLSNLTVAKSGDLYVNTGIGVLKYRPRDFPVNADTTFQGGEAIVPNGEFLPVGVSTNSETGDIYIAERSPTVQSRVAIYDGGGKFVTSFAGSGQEGEVEWAESVAVYGPTGTAFVADRFGGGPFEGGTSQIKVFGPVVAAPTITESFVTKVTADSATLGTSVNPNTLETSYHFEYGPADCSVSDCTVLPAVDIGSGYNPVGGSQAITGLQPGATYHFRVVAQNSEDTSEARGAFTTQTSGFGFDLADSREWEMVSPAQKFGARMVLRGTGPIQAAEDGNGLAFQSLTSIEEDPEGNRAVEPSTILSRRVGMEWQARDLTPPHGAPTTPESTPEYKAFAPDLGKSILAQADDWPLSPEASGQTPYLRTNDETPTFTPMVTAKEGFANVPLGTEFVQQGITVSGASRDLDWVALRSQVPLVADAEKDALYVWGAANRTLRPISVLPGNPGGDVVSGLLGSGEGSVLNAVSADGSRAFWSQGVYGPEGNQFPTALFVRDLETEESVRLDVADPGVSGPGESAPVFLGASADGRTAFFSDSQQLTEGASSEGRDLYRCQLPPHGDPLGCELSNLTAPRANPGENTDVIGLVPGMSEDGTRLYFVATGVLDSGPNQAGETAVPGEPNLYLWQQGGGVRYLATLSNADETTWGTTGAPKARFLSAASSPSGRYLTFMSERSLTGFDNRDADSGEPDQEAFRYDAEADSIVCVSCNPTNARPEGKEAQEGSGIATVFDPGVLWYDDWVAVTLPTGRMSTSLGHSLYRPRAVLDNGRVFFNAVDGLVPADSNGQWDVYQYESSGVGNCSASSGGPSTALAAGGCVSLMSSGTAEDDAGFLDASTTGNDVFFLTVAKLSVTDVDQEYDVYDARVDGVPAKLETNAVCQGEACQPAATAPNDPTPGTAAFQGPGNPKQKAKAHKRCAKRAHRAGRKGKARCKKHRSSVRRSHHRKSGDSRSAGR